MEPLDKHRRHERPSRMPPSMHPPMIAQADGEYAVYGVDGKTHKVWLAKGQALALPYNPSGGDDPRLLR